MPEVAIVTDSIACITHEQVEEYGIKIAPLPLYFGNQIYRDWVDISPSQAYELFLENPDSFKSAGASPGIFLEAFYEAGQEAKRILCVTVSAKISGAYERILLKLRRSLVRVRT